MEQKILSPRVQNAEEADLGAEMFGISSDIQKCLGHRAEQQIVEPRLILEHERVQFVWQREYDMKIARGQKVALSSGDPTLTRLSLAFGAVAIPAGIIGDGWIVATLRAGIAVTAESCRTATHDSAHYLQLLETNAISVTVNEAFALRAKDIGHLHSGPVHRLCFLLLDLFTVASVVIGSVSAGLATACK
jgi:hypothetical protein